MKKIEAIIRKTKFEDVKEALLEADIEVYNTPEDFISGHDTQLIRAVQEMMKEIK